MEFNKQLAEQVAHQLENDWNTEALEDFVNYFTDDVVLISTNIQRIFPDSNGKIEGKEIMKKYWEYTRTNFPYFKYKLHQIDFEENKLILQFFNEKDNIYSNGVLHFNHSMKIYKMVVSYV